MNIKVLLVYEDRVMRGALCESLAGVECSVVAVGTGDEALVLIQQSDFDVVILDLLVTGSDGITTLRQIKNFMPLTEVIVLSTGDTVDAAIKGMRLGAFDYALKPIHPLELMDKILKAKRRKSRQEDKIQVAIKEHDL